MIWPRQWSPSKYDIHGKACGNLVKVVESGHDIHGEIHSKSSDNLAKVVEFEYQIHSMACDIVVLAVKSRDQIHDKATDNVVKVAEIHDEIHIMASIQSK